MGGPPRPPVPDHPFVRYRHHLDLYHHARARGLSDAAYTALVERADAAVAAVAGTGFRVTPLADLSEAVAAQPGVPAGTGPVLAKVETGSVAGSHKARHLFGLLLRLLTDEGDRPGPEPLAIASCGNAALAAATVAASAGRRLLVFVPTDADPVVVDRLHALGAEVEPCPRQPGQTGDPCLAGLRAALAGGARAFSVQGPLCPDVIDGARTLGLELADQLDDAGRWAADLFVQIGGGALATAVMDGLVRARPHRPPPRLHPVQARAAHPYVAAWERLAPIVAGHLGLADPGDDPARARLFLASSAAVRLGLPGWLAARGDVMVPWPGTPASVASGILDDVAYDWVTVADHQVRSGGWPQLASEATLAEAAALAATVVDPPPDATGAAGLAGLLEAARAGTLPPLAPDRCRVVLLTGVDRRAV